MSETSWIHRWKNGKPTSPQQKGPRTMGPTEEIVNLRKSPELREGPRKPGYAAAYARLTELYKEIYGDRVEEDETQ
jgi:transposase-like protein